MMIMNRNQGFQTPWYLQPAFAPVQPQNIVLWCNSSSWDGHTWRNLAPNFANVNHGTLKNGVGIGELIHPSGVFGASLKFDGTDDYVDCGNDESLNITDEITIEAWVKPDSTSQGIYSKGDWWGPVWFYTSTNELRCREGTSSSNYASYGVAFTNAGVWSHVVLQIKASEYIKFYVNGNLAGEKTTAIKDLGDSSAWNANIGRETEEEKYYFNGTIDEVRIYNRALSASDVFHNYTHSPIYYLQHGVEPLGLLQHSAQQLARVVV
ncbi:hypothetical protein DRN97_06250 [Methanosarcinales archaeon]|nr:MAG: hypothetical protein DRN97_06250 [Methanosarcinales archaeon]